MQLQFSWRNPIADDLYRWNDTGKFAGDPLRVSAAGMVGNLRFMTVTSRTFLELPITAMLRSVNT